MLNGGKVSTCELVACCLACWTQLLFTVEKIGSSKPLHLVQSSPRTFISDSMSDYRLLQPSTGDKLHQSL